MKTVAKKIEEASYYMQNDCEKALEIFDEILADDSRNIDAINGKGSTLIKMNRLKEAERCFDYSLSLKENTSALISKGIICKMEEKYDESLSYFNQAISINPRLKNIVSILKDEVIKKMDSNDEFDLDDINEFSKELIKQGINFERKRKYFDAWDCFKQAIEEDNSCKNHLNNHIKKIKEEIQKEFLFKTPDFKECRKEYLKDCRKEDLKKEALKSLSSDENPKNALELFDKVLELDGEDMDALNHKGSLLFYLEDYDGSIEHFNKCLKIDENYYYALFNKGLVLRTLNKLTEALICFDQLLEIEELFDKAKPYQLEILEKLVKK